jgi:hypothetical protein
MTTMVDFDELNKILSGMSGMSGTPYNHAALTLPDKQKSCRAVSGRGQGVPDTARHVPDNVCHMPDTANPHGYSICPTCPTCPTQNQVILQKNEITNLTPDEERALEKALEGFEERAGILEFDAGLSRKGAEALARAISEL